MKRIILNSGSEYLTDRAIKFTISGFGTTEQKVYANFYDASGTEQKININLIKAIL